MCALREALGDIGRIGMYALFIIIIITIIIIVIIIIIIIIIITITTKPRTIITTVNKKKFIRHIQCLFFKQAFGGHSLHFQVYTINL